MSFMSGSADLKHDHAGIGSFVLGATGWMVIIGDIVGYWDHRAKVTNEWLVLGPLVLLINLAGYVLSGMAIKRGTGAKWAFARLALNCAPVLLISICVILAFIFIHWLRWDVPI
jgi:hypothetical protein